MIFRNGSARWVFATLVVMALAACGGGGSGGGADTTSGAAGAPAGSSAVTFTPSSLALVSTFDREESVDVTASVNPAPQGTQFYAVVAMDKPVFQTGAVFFTQRSDNSGTVRLTTQRSLAAGQYTGTLALVLCRNNPQCTDQVALSGNTMSYSVTVLPQVVLTVEGATPIPNSPNSYQIASGGQVTITSNTPVTWSKGSSVTGDGFVVLSSTPTRWQGILTGSNFIGVAASSIQKPTNNGGQAIFNFTR